MSSTPDPVERRRLRLARVWDALAGHDISALIVSGKGTIGQYGLLEWCSGYVPVVRGAVAVLVPGAEPILVVSTGADAWYARERAGLTEVRVAGEGDILSEYDDIASGVAQALSEHGAATGRIGVAGLRHLLTAWEASRLTAALPEAELVDVTAAVSGLKAVKDAVDIEQLQATAAIADEGFEAFLAELAPGRSGWELNAAIEHSIRAQGVRDSLVFISTGAYFLERPTADSIRDGDLVTAYIEIVGPTGYWVELARLVTVGRPTEELDRLAEWCLVAARAAEAELVPGREAGDVARSIDAVAGQSGLRVGIWHGHGVGVDHDPPVITAGDSTPLAEGMVISVHPNFSTADERFGASVADTYVIEAEGPRRLSRLAPGLIESP